MRTNQPSRLIRRVAAATLAVAAITGLSAQAASAREQAPARVTADTPYGSKCDIPEVGGVQRCRIFRVDHAANNVWGQAWILDEPGGRIYPVAVDWVILQSYNAVTRKWVNLHAKYDRDGMQSGVDSEQTKRVACTNGKRYAMRTVGRYWWTGHMGEWRYGPTASFTC